MGFIQKIKRAFAVEKHRQLKSHNEIQYIPTIYENPLNLLDVNSAWKGIEQIIPDIINRFNLQNNCCLEFGVEFGYSTVALSNYFKKITGIDLFIGDKHTIYQGDHFIETRNRLEVYDNISLYRADYKEWITKDTGFYDLIHVDIVHTYKDTYACGLWSVQHSSCTIFHDTESFPAVKKAVGNIARNTGKKFYNYPHCYGLGIVV